MYKSEAVIDNLHARSERGVHQELYAAFTLVTFARRFSNRCDGDFNAETGRACPPCAATSGTACAWSERRLRPCS